MTKLSVNINKVATLRNSRGGIVPNVVQVAIDCERFGADGITIHPRPDERHITRQDVYDLRPIIKTEFNIEGFPSREFVDMVISVKPHQVTLVPDTIEQLTSNAGWDTKKHCDFLSEILDEFKAVGIRTSIFVSTKKEAIEYAAKAGADRVELYTEPYALEYVKNPERAVQPFVDAAKLTRSLGMGLNAGHDLDLNNLNYLYNNIPWLDEVSIGHALISNALYLGLEKTIQEYKKMFIRMMNTLLAVAQVAVNPVDTLMSGAAMGQVVEPESMNLFAMAAKGGWIMIVLAILSLICFYIFFERIYVIRNARTGDPQFIEKVKAAILQGDIPAALNYCEVENSPTSRMIQKGVTRLGRPVNDVQAAIENVGNMEVAKLEKGLNFMATIAGGAPMIGFLGTVTGMVKAFYEMANAGNNVDITLLSGGIYEAMITTIGGLVVGIIAMFAYNYLVSLIDGIVNNMEAKTMAFMDLLNEPAK